MLFRSIGKTAAAGKVEGQEDLVTKLKDIKAKNPEGIKELDDVAKLFQDPEANKDKIGQIKKLLATGGAGAGQFGSAGVASVTLDAFGRVTAVTTATYLTSAVTSVTGTAGQIFVSGGTTPTLNLINTGVTAGSYTANDNFVHSITVDSYGRITSAQNVAVGNANYAIALTTAANTWANATFLKVTGGTVNGDLTFKDRKSTRLNSSH